MSRYARIYSPEELHLYSRYCKERGRCKPEQCDQGAVCWVRDGPPAIMGAPYARCRGCDGKPFNPNDLRFMGAVR